jgi:DNA mismatch repair protein MutS2
MHVTALKALEFDGIRAALAREAATPLGRARAEVLQPATDPNRVAEALALTSETVRAIKAGGSLAIDASDDLQATLAALEVEDQPLDPPGLLSLARFVESVGRVVAGIAPGTPLLYGIASRAASFTRETAAIRRAIDASGDVVDDASPALRDIRDRLRRARAKLRTALDGLVRGRDTSKYLQDQIVTDRNGRYVLVVRAEHRDAIPGVVHGSSASGASLYLEPLSVLDTNNDLVALGDREVEEVRRILLALTNAFRLRGDDLETTLDVAADIDEVQAKARLALSMDAVAPAIASDGRLEFKDARHPLLVLRGRAASGGRAASAENSGDSDRLGSGSFPQPRPVPVTIASDLLLMPPVRALVISGPNTGGKTVALKAVGLLAVMAQSGLLIPVDPTSRFTPFRSVFADIGDDQSIAASLSTFSARVANIVAMDESLDLPALVLLDEVGSGTDPVEGGALGTAVIDHFRKRGATVVATTHDDALKSFAATTEGVATAAFGFDPVTYAPTYRLIYGAPGRSLALEIAERLGMPASVVADARARRSGREMQLAAHLARVDQELAALERRQQAIDHDRVAIDAARRGLLERESRLTEREATLKRRLDDKLNEKLRDAKDEVDRIVGRLKQKAETIADRRAKVPLSTGDLGDLRREGRTALDTIGAEFGGGAADHSRPEPLTEAPAVGDLVFVSTFGTDAVVRAVDGHKIDVEFRGKRMRVSVGDLTPSAPRSPEPPAPTRYTSPRVAAAELVLIGSTVDDALDRAAKFLDDALLSDERRLRVVHGHGTGRLREALRAYFRGHPLVASVSPAPDNEGGSGATIIELRD